ncbi:MAG: S41 family peptidase [Dysgonamonadaceae bacterium]|nr:S41 family peptidase [Dysgonamonadaceae bacterium]
MKHFALVSFLSVCLFACSFGQRQIDPSILKVSAAMSAIENLYVDTIDRNKLAEDAIIGLLEKLDPHSNYLTPEEVKAMNEPLQGNFEGIGVQFNMLTDTLYIEQVIPGGPSEKVGIMAGDRIIFVNDTSIAGVKMKNSDIMSRLRGTKGTTVNVKIKRGNNPNLLVFKIVRDKIPIYSLDASYMIDDETAYIKLNRFAATSYDEFMKAIKELREKGMKNLIFDLQSNGGGYMNAAIDIANEFLKWGDLIVYTEGAHQERRESRASYKGSLEMGKVIVLVDESSASASEIVSGALQDWDRAVIVGRRTFGKGLVQSPIPLPDGSMIRLTVARYHTPTGRSIQKPYEKGNTELYYKEIFSRLDKGEMTNVDSIHFLDSLKYNTLVNRRTVYGGGGIMPDCFVPLDTTRFTHLYRSLFASGTIYKFVMNTIDKNRTSYQKKYSDFESFNKYFTVDEDLLSDLLKLYKEEKKKNTIDKTEGVSNSTEENAEGEPDEQTFDFTEVDMEQFEISKSLIQNHIKAMIARDLWHLSEYYQIFNKENNTLKRAIQIIKSDEEYNKLLGKN